MTDTDDNRTLRERDPDSFTTLTVCLPCADGECYTCYGEGCECRCGGEEAGQPAPGGEPVEHWTPPAAKPRPITLISGP
jgi:hypothetical protein